MKEEKPSGGLIQDILNQGDTLFSQLVTEAEVVKSLGGVDPDIQIRRNELLLKIDDQVIEVKQTIQQVESLQKQLKKNLDNLNQLKKILSK